MVEELQTERHPRHRHNHRHNHRHDHHHRHHRKHGRDNSAGPFYKNESIYLPPAKRRIIEQQEEANKIVELERKKQRQMEEKAKAGEVEEGEEVNEKEKERDKEEYDNSSDDDKSKSDTIACSEHDQRKGWEQQSRCIYGTVNRLNSTTIKELIGELFQNVNLIRMRGVLAKSVLQAAITSSSTYVPVYAALVSVINTKLPEVGELIVTRCIVLFQHHYQHKHKPQVIGTVLFIAELFRFHIVHELLILQLLTVLLNETNITDDSVEVAILLLKSIGTVLLEVSPAGVRAVLERLRALLHDNSSAISSQRMTHQLEHILLLRKSNFRTNDNGGTIPEELDLVEEDDQITFDELNLDDDSLNPHSNLDTFQVDGKFTQQEQEWIDIRNEILGVSNNDSSDSDSNSDDDDDASTTDDDDDESQVASDLEEENNQQQLAVVPPPESKVAATDQQMVVVQDLSESDLVHLRRQIYLTIMSSATFEECAHKLAGITIPPGREEELVNMILECCSQERTFLRYYGLVASRFCILDERWNVAFCASFTTQYTTIHRLETNKLRNVAKLFAFLLHTDAISWKVFGILQLTETHTTSSSRIFIKIIFQEMTEALGIATLKERFFGSDGTGSTTDWYNGLFPQQPQPTDDTISSSPIDVKHIRYSINFFTSIGLGPLTDTMREYIKNAPKLILAQAAAAAAKQRQLQDNDESQSVSSSSSSSSGGSDSSSSLSSSSRSSSSRSSYSSYSSSSYLSRRRGRGRDRRRRRDSSRHRRRDDSNSRSSSVSRRSRQKKKTVESSSRRDEKDSRRSRSNSHSRSSSSSVDRSRAARKDDNRSTRQKNKTLDSSRPRDEKEARRQSRSNSRSRSRSSSADRGTRKDDNNRSTRQKKNTLDSSRRRNEKEDKQRSNSRSRSRSSSVDRKKEDEQRSRSNSRSRSRSSSVDRKKEDKQRSRSNSRSRSSSVDRKKEDRRRSRSNSHSSMERGRVARKDYNKTRQRNKTLDSSRQKEDRQRSRRNSHSRSRSNSVDRGRAARKNDNRTSGRDRVDRSKVVRKDDKRSNYDDKDESSRSKSVNSSRSASPKHTNRRSRSSSRSSSSSSRSSK